MLSARSASPLSARRNFICALPTCRRFMMAVLSLEVILGGLTFTGSLMAAGKLQEILPQRPLTYKGQNFVNLLLLIVAVCNRGIPHSFIPRDRTCFRS